MRKGIFDEQGNLIDAESVAELQDGEIDCGDLPADGSYRYEDGEFVKNASAQRTRVDRDRALFLMIRAFAEDEKMPSDCVKWADWYEKHFGA